MFFRFLMKRKLIVGLFVAFIFLFGIYNISKLDKELFPEINFDQVFVSIETEDMPTIDGEQFIAQPIEKALDSLPGVENYLTTITVGHITIVVDVEKGTGDTLTKDIETTINGMRDGLPNVKQLMVRQESTIQPYEFNLTVTGNNIEEASEFAHKVLKPRLESHSSIREVALLGLEEKEITIELKSDQLAKYGVQDEEILQAIQQTDVNQAIGTLTYEADERSIRWDTTLKSVDDLENISILTNDGTQKLARLANVNEQLSEHQQFAWRNGESDFVLVQVGRTDDASQVDMTNAVRDEYEILKEEGLPEGIQVDEIAAQADYVTNAIDGVIKNILIGALIAIAILILFLRNIRATIIVGLSIPASILLTIIVMTMFDYSFNLATLIGIGLGIGMMVDASIVVMESIYKKKEQGYRKTEAIVRGTKEVMTAVLASMLTTIVVFIPISILENDIGQVVFVLAIVVAITLISSVLISFTLIPVMSENFLKVKRHKKGNLLLVDRYGYFIRWMTKKRRRLAGIIALFIIMFASSLLLITKIPMNVMPDIFDRYTEVLVELEAGIIPEERAEVAEAIHQELKNIDEIEHNTIIDQASTLTTIVNMTPEEEAKREQQDINEEIMGKIRSLEADYPILAISSSLDSGDGGFPVQLRVSGENLDELHAVGNDIANNLKQVDGISYAMSESNHVSEEMVIKLNEQNIVDDQLTTSYIHDEINQLFFDQPIGELVRHEERTPIILKSNRTVNDETDLLHEKIQTSHGEESLARYIELKKVDSPSQIDRDNGERFTRVIADIENRDLGAINRDIQKILDNYNEKDYTISLAGELGEQQEAVTDLLIIFVIALFLVFFVMAIQFNSLKHPIIILSIIPLTITGVILGLFLTQSELNIMSGIGVIMLVGIVLNNAILIIDRIKQLRKEDIPVREAVIESGKDRMRPIFMTTLTTAGGMIPLALATDASSAYQSPLAVVIISGLLFVTMITLILIPAIYLLFEEIGEHLKKLLNRF